MCSGAQHWDGTFSCDPAVSLRSLKAHGTGGEFQGGAMDLKAIEGRAQEVFRDVLEQPELVLSPGLTARDVQGWDSLAHIHLIMALEREFAVKLKASEVMNSNCVGDLLRAILEKLNR